MFHQRSTKEIGGRHWTITEAGGGCFCLSLCNTEDQIQRCMCICIQQKHLLTRRNSKWDVTGCWVAALIRHWRRKQCCRYILWYCEQEFVHPKAPLLSTCPQKLLSFWSRSFVYPCWKRNLPALILSSASYVYVLVFSIPLSPSAAL